MLISIVTIAVEKAGQAGQTWFAFESDHANLHQLNAELAENGTVVGWRLETEAIGNGSRREVARREFILAKPVVLTIAQPFFVIERAAS